MNGIFRIASIATMAISINVIAVMPINAQTRASYVELLDEGLDAMRRSAYLVALKRFEAAAKINNSPLVAYFKGVALSRVGI